MKKKIKAVLRANYEILRQYRDGEISYGRMANILAEKIEEDLEKQEGGVCIICGGCGKLVDYVEDSIESYACYMCYGTGKVEK